MNTVEFLANDDYDSDDLMIIAYGLLHPDRVQPIESKTKLELVDYTNNYRFDKDMIQIFKDFNSTSKDKCSELTIYYIDAKYADYIEYNGYDGLETPYIDYDSYVLSVVKEITNSDASLYDKNEKIKNIIYQDETPNCYRLFKFNFLKIEFK